MLGHALGQFRQLTETLDPDFGRLSQELGMACTGLRLYRACLANLAMEEHLGTTLN